MDNLNLTSNSIPCLMTPIANNIETIVPDISFLQNNEIALSMNFKDISDSKRSDNRCTHPYEQDARLKFYQILQSSSRRNLPKVSGTTTYPSLLALNSDITMTSNNNLMCTTFGQKSLIHHDDDIKQSHRPQKNKKENILAYYSTSTNLHSNFDCILNQRYGQKSIEKLFTLIKDQSEQLELLKLQMNILLSKLSECRDTVTESSQLVDIGIKPFDSIKCHKQKHSDLRAMSTVDKVSIGVMTSSEFSIRNNLNMDVVTAENYVSPKEIYGGAESHETVNLLKSPLEKIAERPEGVFSEKSGRHIIESNRDEQNRLVDRVGLPANESIKASTKVGWTFYNNILCHVNEILHDSNAVRPSQIPYNLPQNSNRQQGEMLESTFSDAASLITSNISDKILTLDSFAYPRVNGQISIMQTSNSMADINASVHIKKLASKYLGDKYCGSNSASKLETSMDGFGATHARFDLILKNTLSLSTKSYTNHDSQNATNHSKYVKPHILDISILKRQPKLL